MIAMVWNCRGLAQPSTIRDLRAMIRDRNPDLIFLMETKIGLIRTGNILNSLGFQLKEIVPAINKVGGLCLAWRLGVQFRRVLSNEHFISGVIESDLSHTPWLIACVHVPSCKAKQGQLWNDLFTVKNNHNGSFLCIGDFNYVTCQDEKSGGLPFAQPSGGGFNSIIEDEGLIDLGFSDNLFT